MKPENELVVLRISGKSRYMSTINEKVSITDILNYALAFQMIEPLFRETVGTVPDIQIIGSFD